MSSSAIQLLVLAGVAIFLILKLRSVLGTRDGFENPQARPEALPTARRADLEVIEGGPDRDITDHVGADTAAAEALAKMKKAEPDFGVSDFLQGARGAYELILMGFERSQLDEIKPFISDEVHDAFNYVVEQRKEKGLTVDAEFIGLRELSLLDASFDEATSEGEIKLRFVGELTSVVRDSAGDIVEGKPREVKRQKDIWTFARELGSDNPNWLLVATGE